MKSNEILKFRSLWMGIAILMVVYFHSYFFITFFKDINSNNFVSVLKELKTFSYGGTDIFLFASGIGCWFSLNKLIKESNSQNSMAADFYFPFITTRFNRIHIFILYWVNTLKNIKYYCLFLPVSYFPFHLLNQTFLLLFLVYLYFLLVWLQQNIFLKTANFLIKIPYFLFFYLLLVFFSLN